MGEHCSAQDHQTLSGSGYGIWCYHNSTSSPVDIDISIDGVDNARMASLVLPMAQVLTFLHSLTLEI